MNEINLSVNIGRMELQNPVMLASGTVGYGNEISEFIDLSKIGAIVTKSISLEPRKGNPPQRVVETASGMLNAIGLANIGLEKFIKEKVPFLQELGTTLIANIAASSIDEYVECVGRLEEVDAVKGFEINVSCPNVKDGGLIFGNNVDNVKKITERVRAVTEKNVIVKLSPNTADIAEFAQAVKDNGGDAVSAINTLVGSAFDIYTKRPKIRNITGGLSGPAIKPVAIAKVLEISRKVDIPVIGIGGISDWKDAAEFMIAGASAFQLGTINFINPTAAIETLDGIKEYCKKMSIKNISEIISSRII